MLVPSHPPHHYDNNNYYLFSIFAIQPQSIQFLTVITNDKKIVLHIKNIYCLIKSFSFA